MSPQDSLGRIRVSNYLGIGATPLFRHPVTVQKFLEAARFAGQPNADARRGAIAADDVQRARFWSPNGLHPRCLLLAQRGRNSRHDARLLSREKPKGVMKLAIEALSSFSRTPVPYGRQLFSARPRRYHGSVTHGGH